MPSPSTPILAPPPRSASILLADQQLASDAWYAFFRRVAQLLGSPTGWTPTDGSGAGLALTSVSTRWVRAGSLVHAYGSLTYPVQLGVADAVLDGLPVFVPNEAYAVTPCIIKSLGAAYIMLLAPIPGTFKAGIYDYISGVPLNNGSLSGLKIEFMLIYPAT